MATKSEAVPKSVVVPDKIEAMCLHIDQLSPEATIELGRKLSEEVDRNYFELGGVLDRISRDGMWKAKAAGVPDGYDSFWTFVSVEYGFRRRKAELLIQIYLALIKSGARWDDVKGIGWTRLRHVVSILTKDNVAEWVDKASTLSLSALIDAVREYKGKTLPNMAGVTPPKSLLTSITFKLHPDQRETVEHAIEAAKKEANTEYSGVALEAICLGYLSGASTAPKPTSLAEVMKGHDPAAVLETFAVIWPEVELRAAFPS